MAAAMTFPRLIMITAAAGGQNVAATGVINGLADSVYNDQTDAGLYNIMGKIEVETAKIDSRYVHLRFVHTNKYWAQSNARDRFVVAVSTRPDEDRTRATCTMFEAVSSASGGGLFGLVHVQSGMGVQISTTSPRFMVAASGSAVNRDAFRFVDSQTIVKLPASVAFKGWNGKYLQYYTHTDNKPFVQFSSDDPNGAATVQQVDLSADGNVAIKCVQRGVYWRFAGDWIFPDTATVTKDTMYRPLIADAETIALRSTVNSQICRSLTAVGLTNVLNARAPSIITETKMEVHELVSQRDIYSVAYRMNQARIFNEVPFRAGETRLRNTTNFVSTQNVSITYTDERSYTFSRSFPLAAGVSTTFRADVPFYDGIDWSVAFDISGAFQWDATTVRSTQVTGTGTVDVPPQSSVLVRYMGTRATSSIPFNYTQQDLNSTNAETVYTSQVDGLYQCVNNYDFDFVIAQVRPI